MTYNILNYEDENNREDDYALIIDFTQPDLIVAQEIIGQTGFSHFQSDVLDVVDPNSQQMYTYHTRLLQKPLFVLVFPWKTRAQ